MSRFKCNHPDFEKAEAQRDLQIRTEANLRRDNPPVFSNDGAKFVVTYERVFKKELDTIRKVGRYHDDFLKFVTDSEREEFIWHLEQNRGWKHPLYIN